MSISESEDFNSNSSQQFIISNEDTQDDSKTVDISLGMNSQELLLMCANQKNRLQDQPIYSKRVNIGSANIDIEVHPDDSNINNYSTNNHHQSGCAIQNKEPNIKIKIFVNNNGNFSNQHNFNSKGLSIDNKSEDENFILRNSTATVDDSIDREITEYVDLTKANNEIIETKKLFRKGRGRPSKDCEEPIDLERLKNAPPEKQKYLELRYKNNVACRLARKRKREQELSILEIEQYEIERNESMKMELIKYQRQFEKLKSHIECLKAQSFNDELVKNVHSFKMYKIKMHKTINNIFFANHNMVVPLKY